MQPRIKAMLSASHSASAIRVNPCDPWLEILGRWTTNSTSIQRDTTKTLFFHKSGSFIETRCVQISYKKLDSKTRLNEREVEILRLANGSKWQMLPPDTPNSYMSWRNEICECQWDRHTGLLQFKTLVEQQRKAAERRTTEKKLLEGF
jgi:hypothetical protein